MTIKTSALGGGGVVPLGFGQYPLSEPIAAGAPVVMLMDGSIAPWKPGGDFTFSDDGFGGVINNYFSVVSHKAKEWLIQDNADRNCRYREIYWDGSISFGPENTVSGATGGLLEIRKIIELNEDTLALCTRGQGIVIINTASVPWSFVTKQSGNFVNIHATGANDLVASVASNPSELRRYVLSGSSLTLSATSDSFSSYVDPDVAAPYTHDFLYTPGTARVFVSATDAARNLARLLRFEWPGMSGNTTQVAVLESGSSSGQNMRILDNGDGTAVFLSSNRLQTIIGDGSSSSALSQDVYNNRSGVLNSFLISKNQAVAVSYISSAIRAEIHTLSRAAEGIVATPPNSNFKPLQAFTFARGGCVITKGNSTNHANKNIIFRLSALLSPIGITTDERGTVALSGSVVPGLSSISTGARYYVADNGALTTSPTGQSAFRLIARGVSSSSVKVLGRAT